MTAISKVPELSWQFSSYSSNIPEKTPSDDLLVPHPPNQADDLRNDEQRRPNRLKLQIRCRLS
jgi:hypothetical protein